MHLYDEVVKSIYSCLDSMNRDEELLCYEGLLELINQYRDCGLSQKDAQNAIVECGEHENDPFRDDVLACASERIYYGKRPFEDQNW